MTVAIQTMPALNGHDFDLDGDSHMNGDGADAGPRFATGLILPPPEIKSVIDRTATWVARSANPPQFEDKIRENQRNDPKFSFLNPADPYHAYYRHRMDRVAAGGADEDAPADAPAKEEEVEEKAPVDVGKEPPPPEFILELPNISAIDLDIMKLTALFTARRGRQFLASLSAREGRNYQFDFLRPTHSLFGYFNRLVDQYTKVLLPSDEALKKLKERAEEGSRWATLEDARQHAKWEQHKREKHKKREDEKEAERIAFAEIDWHDYAIVQTIEFTAADSAAELPAPMSVQQVENMTLAQKRMAAMIHDTTAEDVEAHRARQAAAEAEAAAAVGGAGTGDADDAAMDESDDEGEGTDRRRKEEAARELERAKAMQASSGGTMKIRTDYVPKLGAKNQKSALTTCTICGQQVPVDELQEHMRIELLDPRWKSQRDVLEARKAQASELQRGANVVSSLKNLARTRVDIFGAEADEERRKRDEEAERERRKEREKVVWDGHTASKLATQDRFSTTVNFEEQIAAIHRAKGLGPQDANAIGPGIGPAAAPPSITTLPPAPASLPAPPTQSGSGAPSGLPAANPSYAAATVSSGPQPASMYPPQPPPVMLPPLHYQGLNATQPFGYQPPPVPVPAPGAVPGAAGAGAGVPGVVPGQGGTVRSADEMDTDGDGAPPAKRVKVAKLPDGHFYPEEDWINLHPHPISLHVQLPDDGGKRPEWKLDGGVVVLGDVPLTLLVATLRDRVLQQTGSRVPASLLRFAHAGRMLTNANTLASYNLEDEDVVVLSVRDAKKK